MSAEEIGNCPIADKDNLAACLKCVDSESVEWEVFGNELNFEEAREVCQGVDGGDLAQIKSELEFAITNRLFEAAADLVDDKVEFWIGLFDPNGIDSDSPTRFEFVDGTQLEITDFGGIGNVLPWKDDKPNGDGAKSCVKSKDNVWENFNCAQPRSFLCRYPCPTAAPTAAPTDAPTDAPTEAPTLSPFVDVQNDNAGGNDAEFNAPLTYSVFGVMPALVLVMGALGYYIFKEKKLISGIENEITALKQELDKKPDMNSLVLDASSAPSI